ncbi:hypothetical protein ACFQZQ_06425 [Lysobacter koreensis]|uniref:Gastrin/cholecystokinin peptide hormone domain-containing protein n=1 Tax=Lysobacter koreensis TaxID=266122 RepID=A0ABW2YLL5_9GAMM
MLTRICLCLLIAIASASVAAREVKLSAANSGSCPDTIAASKEPARSSRAIAPARANKAKPSMHSDSAIRQSPRWHSFLPGMFR